MTTLEKFNRTIIEALHGKSYEEAIKSENWCEECEGSGQVLVRSETTAMFKPSDCHTCNGLGYFVLPVTLSRVLKALEIKRAGYIDYSYTEGYRFCSKRGIVTNAKWKLTKPDGYTTATSEDQTTETLTKLLEIFN